MAYVYVRHTSIHTTTGNNLATEHHDIEVQEGERVAGGAIFPPEEFARIALTWLQAHPELVPEELKPKVRIEVLGGVAYNESSPSFVEVDIIDHDTDEYEE